MPLTPSIAEQAGRVALILGLWITATGIGSGSILAGQGREEEVLSFAIQFGLASAVSAALAAIVAGRGRLGREILASVAGFTLLAAMVAYVAFWPAAALVRATFRLGMWDLFQFRHFSEGALQRVASPLTAMGVGGGVVAGVAAGLVLRIKAPAVAAAVGLTLLLAFGVALGPLSGAITDRVIQSRLEGMRNRVASVRGHELASGLGAATGGLVGAVAACLALRMGTARSQESRRGLSPGRSGS